MHEFVHNTPRIEINSEGLIELELEEMLFFEVAIDGLFGRPGG